VSGCVIIGVRQAVPLLKSVTESEQEQRAHAGIKTYQCLLSIVNSKKKADTRAELVPEEKHLDVALPCMYNHVCIVNAFLLS
jgi:hypothetical protein